MRDEGFPLSRTSIAIRTPRCARTAEDANVEQAEVVQVLDRSEQLQNLVAAYHRLVHRHGQRQDHVFGRVLHQKLLLPRKVQNGPHVAESLVNHRLAIFFSKWFR
jgi:hypothetical protein